MGKEDIIDKRMLQNSETFHGLKKGCLDRNANSDKGWK